MTSLQLIGLVFGLGWLLGYLGLNFGFSLESAVATVWRWWRWPHPVVLIGRLIAWLDQTLNLDSDPAELRQTKGVLALTILLTICASIGVTIHLLVLLALYSLTLFGGIYENFYIAVFLVVVPEAVVVAIFLAGKSLAGHVRAVARALNKEGLDAARLEVAHIVGRDPESLDEAGVSRAAIESLAENFSDAVVAPAIWCLLLGLPGLIVYKAVNTADSMIGHMTDRHRYFGWASARLDDIVNLPASRLSALLISFAARSTFGREAGRQSAEATRSSARNHRSPNAGWPEAAMAGALGVALAGPRRYGDLVVDDPWMNPCGRRDLSAIHIGRALLVYRRAHSLFTAGCFLVPPVVVLLFLQAAAALG